jgi:hypothetical protein
MTIDFDVVATPSNHDTVIVALLVPVSKIPPEETILNVVASLFTADNTNVLSN